MPSERGFDALAKTKLATAADVAQRPSRGAGAIGVRSLNDDLLEYPERPTSLALVAEQCAAVAEMRDKRGNVPEPHWRGGLGVAKYCNADGEALAHKWSSGYDGYTHAETQAKMDRWDTPPPTCDHFAKVCSACEGCPHKGKITTPVQLGRSVVTAAPGVTTDGAPAPDADAPDWVRELNRQYAQARVGSKMVITDDRTVYAGAQGITYSMGYLDIAAFRARHAGQFVPVAKIGERPQALADAWLSHPQRRQYDGVVFSPGEPDTPGILNLWQGFAVQPAPGDVSVWLRLLEVLVSDPVTRSYVLDWIAWKVQNPGGVPDTVLAFTSGKGAGKNSLFTPLLTAFGRHGMLADDPELVAGRFTYHLMYMALGVLDEAVFVGDPRQADRIKSRVTARHMLYEQKGFDPVPGINRCAYVMLTNHAHVWQATTDERRAVVIEAGDGLRGDHAFWKEYHAWANGPGPAALLHYLQGLDVSGFNPRAIPKTDALARQVEMTALRDPVTAWWHDQLDSGALIAGEGLGHRRIVLHDDQSTEVARDDFRSAFVRSFGQRGEALWASASKRIRGWCGSQEVRRREHGMRARFDLLPPLPQLRSQFTEATGVRFD